MEGLLSTRPTPSSFIAELIIHKVCECNAPECLEWPAAVCTAIPHLSVQFVQSLVVATEYN